MVVSVRLHATLRKQTDAGMIDHLDINLAPEDTVAAVLAVLKMPSDDDHILLVVNGRVVLSTHALSDGDEVRLMPAMSGGEY